jgi:peptide/nickel transport system permease protein
MTQVLARRLLLVPVVLLIASVLIFVLAQVVPADPARAALGPYATDEQLTIWREQHQLTGSWWSQYSSWLGGVVRGDWGDSVRLGVPVRPLVLGRLGNSVLLGLLAFVLVVPVSIAVGVAAALRRGKPSDRAITMSGLALASTPEFVTGAILLVVFAVHLRWFPVNGQLPTGVGVGERLRVMFLPALTVALGLFGYISRVARAGAIEVLASPYYLTAELKGLPRRRVIGRHVLRNALLPTTAVVGTQLGVVLGGVVVVETLFNYPGVGLLLVDAARDHDLTVLEAAALTTTAVSMLAMLLTDVTQLLLDPRVRFERTS